LARKGTLKSKVVDRALICPHCGSPEVHSKFTCPRCNYESVELTQLIEHKKCGYIGALSDFSKPNGLVCPRCRTTLTSDPMDYRIIGNFYQCENCGNRFDKPEVKHICQNCGKPSTFQDVKYEKVFSYRVSEEVVRELGRELPILENIRLFLVDKGFTVKLPSEVAGASGVKSSFAIIAEKGDVRIVVDVSLEGNKKDLVALLAKKVDVNPTRALILDLSGGAELATLGKIYGIDAVTARADQKVPKELEELLAKYV
jgi:transcription elongation factor Elf1